MQRCNKIYNNPLYRERLSIIEKAEQDRIFCKHDLIHFLDVARIGYIMILENNLNIDKELFYAAALLHDAGRYTGIPHNLSGAELARIVMPECGFSDEETDIVYNAILGHRLENGSDTFTQVLYTADKKSRLCHSCKAQRECYWNSEKRNNEITI